MFTTFNAILPTYEVITPQTKQSLLLKSMTIADEEKMKASLMNESKILGHLNKCIFDSITDKDPKYTFKEFLITTTLKDREALLYGLYHITYEEIRNYTVSCSKCKTNQDVTVKASDTFSVNIFPGKEKEILKKRITIPLEILNTVKVVLKQPTLNDENEIARRFAFSADNKTDIWMESLIIESIEYLPENAVESEIYTIRDEIVQGYLSFPAKDKKLINKKYIEEFGTYAIKLQMQTSCTKCGNTEVIDIDLVDNFFRAMYQ